jgi:hypothetical protein
MIGRLSPDTFPLTLVAPSPRYIEITTSSKMRLVLEDSVKANRPEVISGTLSRRHESGRRYCVVQAGLESDRTKLAELTSVGLNSQTRFECDRDRRFTTSLILHKLEFAIRRYEAENAVAGPLVIPFQQSEMHQEHNRDLAYRIHGWNAQLVIAFELARLRSRSGLAESRELQLILPHTLLDRTFPRLG